MDIAKRDYYFIDSHCHLSDKKFDNDIDNIIERARNENVEKLICVGDDLASCTKSFALSNKFDEILTTVGVHPHHAKWYTKEMDNNLRQMVQNNKPVAIGETGLDFYYTHSCEADQIDALKAHIKMASDFNLPLVIHCREAFTPLLDILGENNSRDVGGVVHCFSGTFSQAQHLTNIGFYIGIGGPVTYPNATPLREIVREISLDHIVLETDSPYLPPQARRGRRNEPSYLRLIAKQLAELKNLSIRDIARITRLNTLKLYRIPFELVPVIVYPIRQSLYLNITNKCTNNCAFCRRSSDFMVKGHYLKLDEEPTFQEIRDSIEANVIECYNELVFCGFGEPTLRLDIVKKIAALYKKKNVKIRLDTNGLGSLYHKRNIIPELKGLIDSVSISLNAPDQKVYNKICNPDQPREAFNAVIDFAKKAKKHFPEVLLTVVEGPEIDIKACRKVAESEIGVDFRVRSFHDVG